MPQRSDKKKMKKQSKAVKKRKIASPAAQSALENILIPSNELEGTEGQAENVELEDTVNQAEAVAPDDTVEKAKVEVDDTNQAKEVSPEGTESLAKKLEFDDILDPKLLSRWSKPGQDVPTIFLHKTADFAPHCKDLLLAGVKFYQPYLGTNYTRIFCLNLSDHKEMVKYFNKNSLPFHTFGYPKKKKMRVVIRGLPTDTDLDIFNKALTAADIPIVRMHNMHIKEFAKDKVLLVLAVVPYNDKGWKLLRLKKAFGHDIIVEPPIQKTQQCHRCQKWGHAQRYCRGILKCVKCAGDHHHSKCTRDPDMESPTCANCGGDHTASYRECFYCPDSTEYKNNKRNKINRMVVGPSPQRILVTLENHESSLYRKIRNIPKHNEAVPF